MNTARIIINLGNFLHSRKINFFDSSLMAVLKRSIQITSISRRFFDKSTSFAPSIPQITPLNYGFRRFSQLQFPNDKKRALIVDTLALVRSLEAQGLPQKQAEAITSVITRVFLDSLDNISQSFVAKSELHRTEVLQDSNIARFKGEVHSSQDHHFNLLRRENEKLQGDIEKLRSELKNDIDKVTAGQRLDMNLERGRIRDEIANQKAEISSINSKLDREMHALKAYQEAGKVDLIKYVIGTIFSLAAVGMAVIRSMK